MNIICDTTSPLRLDLFLNQKLNISRSQALNLVKKQLVKINYKIAVKSGILVKPNDIITLSRIIPNECVESKSDIFIQRIYEDNDILVINKPPHLATHGAPSLKEESLVDWLRANKIQLSNISGEKREGIVHRLDKQTSGAMVIAKNNISHMYLSKQLQNHTMGRLYIALIDLPLKDNMEIECNLSRNPKNRLKISKTNRLNGRYSKSNFFKLLLSKDSKKEMILAKLSTGRTHQIRAHLESFNRHILGDSLYGYKGEKMRIMLHSYILHLEHPNLGKMSFVADMFDDMRDYLQNNFDMERVNEILENLSNNKLSFSI
ncbi:hypothetical protein CCY99_06210 [Helicobacter sp. 16-1353]|uniref:RluA family pseudouridine synthase n=1 Tax=Helicobacter sp. 16-1353 TaxID=2004996 RepID=UPI000DCF4C08|nr:RluA family pseudouridine synthase [Helicobacter sp. 16-1353]RAX53184.1 hypothetical protein CCY99_06210 [Helicobacter sp. 16-1353]